jgi:hypothetical protein
MFYPMIDYVKGWRASRLIDLFSDNYHRFVQMFDAFYQLFGCAGNIFLYFSLLLRGFVCFILL